MRFPGFYLKGKQISTEQSLAKFSSMQTLNLITSDTKQCISHSARVKFVTVKSRKPESEKLQHFKVELVIASNKYDMQNVSYRKH